MKVMNPCEVINKETSPPYVLMRLRRINTYGGGNYVIPTIGTAPIDYLFFYFYRLFFQLFLLMEEKALVVVHIYQDSLARGKLTGQQADR